MSETRDIEILRSAQKLIFRHGYSKVGMKDIADDCSISRPTLYKFFSNKEAIVANLVERQAQSSKLSASALIESQSSLEEKLQSFFDIWIVSPAAVAIDSINGRDLLTNVERYAPEAVQNLYMEFERQLTVLLAPSVRKKGVGSSAEDIAHLLALASKGLKSSSSSLLELKRLIDGLVSLTVAAIEK